MTDFDSSSAQARASQIRERVLKAFAGVDVPEEVVLRDLPSSGDLESLIESAGEPTKILQVGGDIGVSTLALALCFPDATIVRVDPDLPTTGTTEGSRGMGWGAATVGAIAEAAAREAGVASQIEFITGGFSESSTSRSVIGVEEAGDQSETRGATPIVGPDVCSKLQRCDLAFIGGLTSAEARASDIRLAASILSDAGVIVSLDSVGVAGANVRAGVFEFLRFYPDYTFLHARHGQTQRSFGYLKKRSAGWAGGYLPRSAAEIEDPNMGVRETLANLVALSFGSRPILEVTIGPPILGAEFRSRGVASRTLRLTATDWNTHFFDPVIDQICTALDHTPGSALFSSDLMDFAPDEFVGRLFRKLADRQTSSLFFATPPGERDISGPRSRPAARIIDLATGQGLTAYAPAGLEFERARHAGSIDSDELGGTARHASFLMFGHADGLRDARDRSIMKITPHGASVREQVELQRIFAEAELKRSRDDASARRASAEQERDEALRRWRQVEVSSEQERTSVERTIVALRSELLQLQDERASLVQAKSEAEMTAQNAETRRQRYEDSRAETEAELRAQLNRATNERDEAVRRLTDLRDATADEKAASDRALAVLRADIVHLKDERSRMVQAITEAESAGRLAESRINQLETRRTDAEVELRREIDVARAEVDAAYRERDRFKEELAAVTARSVREYDEINARLEELNAANAELEARLLESDGSREEAEASRSEELAAVREELASTQQRLAAATSELDGLNSASRSEIDRLKAQLADSVDEELLREQDNEIASLRREIETLNVTLGSTRSSLERELAERKAELDRASQRLSDEEMHVVAASIREKDARVGLDGVASHLDLSQRTLARFREDPAAFRADSLSYAHRRIGADNVDGLVGASSMLHGESADLSREISVLLEQLGRERAEYENWKTRQVQISETSHINALDTARLEMSDMYKLRERLTGRVASSLALNNRLLTDIIALTPGAENDPVLLMTEVERIEAAGVAEPTLDMLSELEAQERRLMHLLHTMEAERSAWTDDVPIDPPEMLDDILDADEAGVFQTRETDHLTVEPSEDEFFDAATSPSAGPETREAEVIDWRTATGGPAAAVASVPDDASFGWAQTPLWTVEPRARSQKAGAGMATRLLARVRTYPETARLVRLQRDLREKLAGHAVSPRVFDIDLYTAHGDVDPYAEPLHHYLLEGEEQGWSPLAGFDPEYYAKQVGDLGQWKGSLLRHFLSRGVFDRRAPSAQLENLADHAAEAGLDPLEYFFRWENAARGTWRTDYED